MKTSDLKITVAHIPDAGLVREGELPADALGDVLLDAYEAASPLRVRLTARRVNDNVLVEGRVAVALHFECSRTLAPSAVTIDVPFSELYTSPETAALNLADGVGAEVFEGDIAYVIVDGLVDVEDLIREHLVLAQDPYPVAEGAAVASVDDSLPAWTSDQVEVDPRWAALKTLKLD